MQVTAHATGLGDIQQGIGLGQRVPGKVRGTADEVRSGVQCTTGQGGDLVVRGMGGHQGDDLEGHQARQFLPEPGQGPDAAEGGGGEGGVIGLVDIHVGAHRGGALGEHQPGGAPGPVEDVLLGESVGGLHPGGDGTVEVAGGRVHEVMAQCLVQVGVRVGGGREHGVPVQVQPVLVGRCRGYTGGIVGEDPGDGRAVDGDVHQSSGRGTVQVHAGDAVELCSGNDTHRTLLYRVLGVTGAAVGGARPAVNGSATSPVALVAGTGRRTATGRRSTMTVGGVQECSLVSVVCAGLGRRRSGTGQRSCTAWFVMQEMNLRRPCFPSVSGSVHCGDTSGVSQYKGAVVFLPCCISSELQ